jgi:DNA-binding MarR family transcriptional regulator
LNIQSVSPETAFTDLPETGQPTPGSKPRAEMNFAPALLGAGRSLLAAMMTKVAECGFRDMTPAFASLVPLLDEVGERPTVLARRAGITKQAISQLVHELEVRGYVEQIADPTDTRAKIVRLSERGVASRAACRAMRQRIIAIAAEALGGVAGLGRLHQDLLRLTGALNEAATPSTSAES